VLERLVLLSHHRLVIANIDGSYRPSSIRRRL